MEDRNTILALREAGAEAITVTRGGVVTGTGGGDLAADITQHMDPSDRMILVPARDSQVANRLAADLPVPHPLISAPHALLTPPTTPGGPLSVRDLGSARGTWVGNRRLGEDEEIQVPPGATIYLGPVPVQWDGEAVHVPTAPRPPILEARHLRVRAPGRKGCLLLDDVSLSIQPGKFVAIIGPSGAGKSTLLRALCGRVPLAGGHVIVGQDHAVASGPDATSWGYVPQDDTLHTGLHVRRALGYVARLRLPPDWTRQRRRECVEAALRDVGITEKQARQQIKTLSGGQRKRIGIACELLVNPAVLFLDEPTSGLDPHLDASIMHILRHLAHEGHTVVLVTHSIAHLDMVDTLAFVGAGGRLLYYGPPGKAVASFKDVGVASYADLYERFSDAEQPRDDGEDVNRARTDAAATGTTATGSAPGGVAPDLTDGRATAGDIEDGLVGRTDGVTATRLAGRDAIRQTGVLMLRYMEVHLWRDKGNLRLILVGTGAISVLLRWISVDRNYPAARSGRSG